MRLVLAKVPMFLCHRRQPHMTTTRKRLMDQDAKRNSFNPYLAPPSVITPSASRPHWTTKILLAFSLAFSILLCLIASSALIQTARHGPLPGRGGYGPMHAMVFGVATLFPLVAFWTVAATIRRRLWSRLYVYLALCPLVLFLTLFFFFVGMAILYPDFQKKL